MFKFLPSLNYSFRISARNCSTKSTGIEHALNQKKLGARNKMDFQKDYKCIDYLNYSTFSFYDKENELREFRVPQPSNKRPDNEPKCKQ